MKITCLILNRIINSFFLSEVLISKTYYRGIKYDLKFCEDAIFSLINLIVKKTNMINLKKLGILEKVEKFA